MENAEKKPGWLNLCFGSCPREYLACALQWGAAVCLLTGYFALDDAHDRLATLLIVAGTGMAFAGLVLLFFGDLMCGPLLLLGLAIGLLGVLIIFLIFEILERIGVQTGYAPDEQQDAAGQRETGEKS